MSFTDFFDEPKFDYETEKQKFIENMDFLKAMSVQEMTLYKKFREIKDSYASSVDMSQRVKAKIWQPTDITNKDLTVQELQTLQPRIRYVDPKNKQDMADWLMLRVFVHTMSFDQNPGRMVRFLVYDEVSGKYLGATSLASDVIAIAARDEWIGWKQEDKLDHGRLNNSAIGSCIMSTQPFGYNFLGGKLVASLMATDHVAETWQSLYDNILVGLTTTSLYGTESMYNSIPFWKKLGATAGRIVIKPDDSVYDVWHHWIKSEKADLYEQKILNKGGTGGPITGIKQRTLNLIMNELGIKMTQYEHGFERGVYYALRYENGREFFRGEIEADKLIKSKKLEHDIDSVLDWWRPKAIARYERLHDEGKIKPEILYYNKILDLSWDETKAEFMGEVGR